MSKASNTAKNPPYTGSAQLIRAAIAEIEGEGQ